MEYSNNPNVSNEQFRLEIGREYFGGRATEQKIDALFAIQDIFALERTWHQPSPIVSVDRCRALNEAGGLTPETKDRYLVHLNKLREIAARYDHSEHETERNMHELIDWVLKE